jgi:hypothetical protein
MNRKFNRSKASRALKRAAQMPPLRHTQRGHEFDIAKSEVVRWLCEQPEILLAMFNHYKDQGAIVFRDGHWQGVESQ